MPRPPDGPSPAAPADPPPGPRQRWRLVLARDPGAPAMAQRDLAEAWLAAFDAAGLPVAWTEGARPRPRAAFGAPLPVGMAARGELIDLVITERWPAWRVRDALEGHLPTGWRVVDLHDVWLAGPPLPGRVAAADYRIVLDGAPGAEAVAEAAHSLLAATSVARERAKGGGTVPYDLRPLLVDVRLADPGPPVVIGARTRFHPELGTGRPEEVVGALADRLGTPLAIADVVRERLVLAEDLDAAALD